MQGIKETNITYEESSGTCRSIKFIVDGDLPMKDGRSSQDYTVVLEIDLELNRGVILDR